MLRIFTYTYIVTFINLLVGIALVGGILASQSQRKRAAPGIIPLLVASFIWPVTLLAWAQELRRRANVSTHSYQD